MDETPVGVQVAFLLDVTGSMTKALSAAKNSLRKAGEGIAQLNPNKLEMSVITYHDYKSEGAAFEATRDDGLSRDGSRRTPAPEDDRFALRRGAPTRDTGRDTSAHSRTEGPKKTIEALNYPGKRPPENSQNPEQHQAYPIFTTPKVVENIVDAVLAEGGDDAPEMVEAALAVATQLPWEACGTSGNAMVQTIYIALDALPHAHTLNVENDDFNSLDKITEAQKKLTKDVSLSNAEHPEDWLTQVIVLARKGIVINPMICAKDSTLVFFATFIASLSGGSAIFIDNAQWENNLEAYVKDSVSLDISELRNTGNENNLKIIRHERTVLAETKYSGKISVPSPEVYEKVKNLILEIESTLKNQTLSAHEAAQKIRPIYENAVRAYQPTNHATTVVDRRIPDSFDTTTRREALGRRLERKTIEKAERPRLPILETKPEPEKEKPKAPEGYFLDEITKTVPGNNVFFKFDPKDEILAKKFVEENKIPALFDKSVGKYLPQPDPERCPGFLTVRVPTVKQEDGSFVYEALRKKIPALPKFEEITKIEPSMKESYAKNASKVGFNNRPAAPAYPPPPPPTNKDEKCCTM